VGWGVEEGLRGGGDDLCLGKVISNHSLLQILQLLLSTNIRSLHFRQTKKKIAKLLFLKISFFNLNVFYLLTKHLFYWLISSHFLDTVNTAVKNCFTSDVWFIL